MEVWRSVYMKVKTLYWSWWEWLASHMREGWYTAAHTKDVYTDTGCGTLMYHKCTSWACLSQTVKSNGVQHLHILQYNWDNNHKLFFLAIINFIRLTHSINTCSHFLCFKTDHKPWLPCSKTHTTCSCLSSRQTVRLLTNYATTRYYGRSKWIMCYYSFYLSH